MGRRLFLSLIAALFTTRRLLAERPPMPVGDPILPPMPVGPPVVRVSKPTFRSPVGHTHTCAAGHTWDHRANPGHTCIAPVVKDGKITQCGLYENDKDNPPRPVGVYATETVAADEPEATAIVNPLAVPGCANGNCPTERRFFRRR